MWIYAAFVLYSLSLSSGINAQNVVCPDDITMTVASGEDEIAVSWADPTPDDTPLMMESSRTNGSMFGVGRHAVLYTVDYTGGVSVMCFFYVIIRADDGRAGPNINRCPTSRTPQTYETFNNVNCSLPFDPPFVSQTMVTFTSTHTPQDTFEVGTYHVVYTFTNVQGFVSECVIPITVTQGSDVCRCFPCPNGETCNLVQGSTDSYTCVMQAGDLAPFIQNCPEDLEVILPNGMVSVSVDWIEPTASDDVDGVLDLVTNYNPRESFTLGITQVVYNATDSQQQSTFCVFNVEVSQTADTTSPVFVNCPSTVTHQLPIGEDTASVTWTEPSATDNDGQVTVDSTRSPGDNFTVGTSHVVYTATDEAGLQSTCDFNVRIKATEDHIPPVVSGCPFAAVAEISGTFTVVRWSIPTSADGSLVELPTLGSPGDFFTQGVLGPEYYIFNDTAGNIAACPLYIFVVDRSDTVGPTVSSCPSDVTGTVEPGIFTMAATWTPPSATDDVTSQGNIIQIATNDPGDSFGVGTTTVTYVFLDEQGNNGTCQFNVVVIQTDGDTVPPVFSGCPPNIDILAPFGATSTSVTWTEPTASDSGFQLTVSSDNSPGANFPIGVTTVTYTATDMSGLNSQCTFNVIVRAGVVDNIRPVLTCPSFTPQIVELGTDTVELSFNDPEIMDESNTATLSHRSHNFPFNFSVSVATIVEFEAMDQAGNVGSCSFLVFFRGADSTPPTVMCPDPINRTVELGQGVINVSFPNANATDFSVVTLVSQSHTSGDAFSVGETNVTFVFQDEGANIGECSFPISVVAVDTTPPEVICPSIFYETVELGLNSTTIIFPNDTATATDLSGMPSLFSITPPSGSVFDIGQTLVTVVFTDMSNNLGNCTFTVNVSMQDTTPPMLICPETIIRETEIGQGPVNVSFDDPVISDASNTAMIVSRSHNSGVFFPAGAVTLVNFTAADESGNNASCSLAIFIMEVDRTDPVLSCPTNIIEEVELGVSTLTIPFDNPTIMDASNTAMITSSTHTSPWMFPVGETTTVTFDGRDESGNEGSCSLNVTVNTVDSTDPFLVCPADVNMTIELGPTEYEIPFLDAIVVDFAITTLSSSHTPPGPFPVGSTTVVTFTAIDQSGNQGNCSFSIDFNIVDTTGPTVTCPPSVTEIVESAQPAVVTFDNATATDLSGVVIFVSQSAQSGGVFPFGLSTVTFTFQDSSGNNGSCDISITVDTDQCLSSPCINGVCIDRVNSFECICDPGFDGPICDTADNTPPVVTCPTNIEQTVELGQPGPFQVTFDNATAIDTSGTVGLLNRSHDSGENFPIGQTVVTFVFGDVSGNFNNCSFLITINEVDETPPVPSCHDDIVDTVEPGVPGKRVTFDLVNATDNSGSATLVTHSPVSGSLFPVGSTSVIFLYTDMAGNQASCFFYVNITEADNLPPEAICPENVSGTAQPGSSYAAVDFTLPVATDNSGMARLVSISSGPGSNFTVGTTVVTATFQDPAGNSDSCSFAVVVDGENSTVTVSDLGNDFFELTWTNDISMDIIAYTILLADTDGAVVERRSFAPSMTMIIQRFEQLTPGTQYTIDVDAVISSTMAMVNFAALSVVTIVIDRINRNSL
ncbi:hyalin-like isoform X2 [Lytechinus variegatus]|uniref:hyalin-like isoform X2 n=1 Tax=Lytechinus variegatus TaxID=7654 RepID=UPI001BB2ABFE|nr:hyalin-like isoform X2 [Lytechinus variegatus]